MKNVRSFQGFRSYFARGSRAVLRGNARASSGTLGSIVYSFATSHNPVLHADDQICRGKQALICSQPSSPSQL